MSLWGTLNVARTGLATSQAALQTVGNNIANAGNEGYTRQVVKQQATKPQEVRAGLFVGTGVDVKSIERQIDESVEQRLRASLGDSKGAANTSQWLERLEGVYNELSDEDLSTGMSAFFNAWSDLANKPEDVGLRQVVVQSGQTLANHFQATRQQVVSLRTELNGSLGGYTKQADQLAQQVADLNRRISVSESGAGQDNGLRDQRDVVLKDLAALMNITTGSGDNGMVNVYVGSEPLVMNGQSRGLMLRRETDAETGDITQTLAFRADDGTVPLTGAGILGSAKEVMGSIQGALDHVDDLAGSLVFELNKLHASGQGTAGVATTTAENAVADTAARLDSKAADLAFKPANGSFVVHVKDKATGASTSTLIQVDLDNADGTGTSLDSLRAALDGVGNVNASINAGKLTVASETSATEISFSQDSSGVLAALGINNFFSGSDARDIAVSKTIGKDPSRLNAAANGQPADNGTAKKIAALQDAAIASLGGRSLTQSYEGQVTAVATKLENAHTAATAAGVVLDTMQGQRDAISGVNLDEEAIALMRYQRAYQASSRVIAATDEMLQIILGLV